MAATETKDAVVETTPMKATVRAGSNIAFIKYWGVRDPALFLPLSNSISMTLADAFTTTTVEWLDETTLEEDQITLDGNRLPTQAAERLVRHLDRIRRLAGTERRARVVSVNNFPMAAGIASSASGFAALSAAGAAALKLELTPTELSALSRLGSGSASRSIFGGYVEWEQGHDHASSVAHPLFPADHWRLHDIVAVVSSSEKKVSSANGHSIAATSPLNAARIASLPAALATVRDAIAQRDLAQLGPVLEYDALAMHSVMMTGNPSLLYFRPGTLEVLHAVRDWREEGLPAWFTIDAGPNVHVICEEHNAGRVAERLGALAGVDRVISSGPGPAPQLIQEHLF